MSDETDLYETDAAYVEAWERWAAERRPEYAEVRPYYLAIAKDAKRRAQANWRVNVPEIDQ